MSSTHTFSDYDLPKTIPKEASSSTSIALTFPEPLSQMKAALNIASSLGYSPATLCAYNLLLSQLESRTLFCNRFSLVRNVIDAEGYNTLAHTPLPSKALLRMGDLCPNVEPAVEPSDSVRNAVLAHTLTLPLDALLRRRDSAVKPLPTLFTARLTCSQHANHDNPRIDPGRRSVGSGAGSINGRIVPPWTRGLDALCYPGLPLVQSVHDPKKEFVLHLSSKEEAKEGEENEGEEGEGASDVSITSSSLDIVVNAPWIRGCKALFTSSSSSSSSSPSLLSDTIFRARLFSHLDGSLTIEDDKAIKDARSGLISQYRPRPVQARMSSLQQTEPITTMTSSSVLPAFASGNPSLTKGGGGRGGSKIKRAVHFEATDGNKGGDTVVAVAVADESIDLIQMKHSDDKEEEKETSTKKMMTKKKKTTTTMTTTPLLLPSPPPITLSSLQSSSTSVVTASLTKLSGSKEVVPMITATSTAAEEKKKGKTKTKEVVMVKKKEEGEVIKKEKKMSGRGWYYVTDSEGEEDEEDELMVDVHMGRNSGIKEKTIEGGGGGGGIEMTDDYHLPIAADKSAGDDDMTSMSMATVESPLPSMMMMMVDVSATIGGGGGATAAPMATTIAVSDDEEVKMMEVEEEKTKEEEEESMTTSTAVPATASIAVSGSGRSSRRGKGGDSDYWML